MWFMFPQLRGLGTSTMAHLYGISGLGEAKAYLAHPVLSGRLYELCGELLKHKDIGLIYDCIFSLTQQFSYGILIIFMLRST